MAGTAIELAAIDSRIAITRNEVANARGRWHGASGIGVTMPRSDGRWVVRWNGCVVVQGTGGSKYFRACSRRASARSIIASSNFAGVVVCAGGARLP